MATQYKLKPLEAADLIVNHLQEYIATQEANLAALREDMGNLRKNSKDRPRYEQAIRSLEGHTEVKKMKLAEALKVREVADELFEITERIGDLCQQRRNLTPGIPNPEVHLLSAMRNGF